MKKAGDVIASVFAGVVLYGLIMGIAEALPIYFSFLPIIALGASIFAGYRLYVYLCDRNVPPVISAISEPKSELELWLLYALFVMQVVFSVGYANEFSDHAVAFGISGAFFIVQILLIYRAIRKRGSTIFIAVLLLLSIFQLAVFLTDSEAISNKYPAEQYYETYGLVLWMLIGSIALELIKLVTLHYKNVRRVVRL